MYKLFCLKNIMMFGLGVKKKTTDYFEEMADVGKKSFEESGGFIKENLDKAEEGKERIKETCRSALNSTLKQCNIPTEDEVERLKKEIKFLKGKIKSLEGETKEKHKEKHHEEKHKEKHESED